MDIAWIKPQTIDHPCMHAKGLNVNAHRLASGKAAGYAARAGTI
jgi:hypothetical protein